MVQKSDNEFVKSRIELHCIVPFANTIIPDSRKKKQPLRTRTFPNLRTMNGLRFIGGIGTSGCLRAECFPLPVHSLHLAEHAKSPLAIQPGGIFSRYRVKHSRNYLRGFLIAA